MLLLWQSRDWPLRDARRLEWLSHRGPLGRALLADLPGEREGGGDVSPLGWPRPNGGIPLHPRGLLRRPPSGEGGHKTSGGDAARRNVLPAVARSMVALRLWHPCVLCQGQLR